MKKVQGEVQISNERNTTADLLKGIAVILMIQVHLVELFAVQEIYSSSIGKFLLFLGGPPAAPIFMAIMGYFVFSSHKTTTGLILRGIKLAAGGILLNIGLNLHLLISISSGKFNLNPYQYIFGSDILPLAGLSIIILALLKHYFRNNILIYVSAGIVVMILTPLLPDIYSEPYSAAAYLQAFFWGNLEWSYFPLFPWLFYPIAGYTFGILKPAIDHLFANKTLTYPSVAAISVFLMLTFNYGIEISSTLPVYYHHDIFFAGWTLAFLSLYTAAAEKINSLYKRNAVSRYLRWVGKNVTAFYVFQWLLIGNIATAIFKTQDGMQLLIWFVVITMMVTLLVWVLNYSKANSKLWFLKAGF